MSVRMVPASFFVVYAQLSSIYAQLRVKYAQLSSIYAQLKAKYAQLYKSTEKQQKSRPTKWAGC
ncbi:hypothetical protein [Planomicrobium sp. MB-3u-38]|uniref:hypothetical protein n=1 Tax=Planomicrobium sp. MB-3u-38 TaxID=2058318 RepID=UPI000C7BC572|nr:hypothetical protein [Planomicrobium sp. MB-3u-38]PKH10474.1 hypothetical protein CXF70_09850 [Planomicrobium sp. MB-3u-38]